MIIGTFAYDHTNDSYQGAILTLGFDNWDVEITPTDSSGGEEPNYRVTTHTASGGIVDLGAGWKCHCSQGHEFVSVTLDSPLLPAPIGAGRTRGLVGVEPRPSEFSDKPCFWLVAVVMRVEWKNAKSARRSLVPGS